MIEVESLSKSYGALRALSDVSFTVRRGEILGFLGPNGAGKTTTLRIITGSLGATRGRVLVDSHDVSLEPELARMRIGYMPEGAPLYPELRVREYLLHRAALKGVGGRQRAAALGRALERTQTVDVADWLIGRLSKGYRQRVALADALISEPPILILDEPTAGLDPNQMREVRSLLRTLSADHTILLSTHLLSEVEASCDRAVVLHRGRLVAQGTVDELRRPSSQEGITCSVMAPRSALAALVAERFPTMELEVVAESAVDSTAILRWAHAAEGCSAAAVIRALVEAGFEVRSAVPLRTDLEQVFAQLTGSDPVPQAAQEAR